MKQKKWKFRPPIIDGQMPDRVYALSLDKKGKIKMTRVPNEEVNT